jgi:hypothetical protein
VNSDLRPPAERVGPGLWSIPVPIPWNPLVCTLAYLIESAAGPVLRYELSVDPRPRTPRRPA